nr:hypothetical protein [Nonomuraea pusilla]
MSPCRLLRRLQGPLQYRNVHPDYVERLWDLVDRADVAARHTAATST